MKNPTKIHNPKSKRTTTVPEESFLRTWSKLGWVQVDDDGEVVPIHEGKTIDEILEDVGDSPEAARVALGEEQAKDHPRTTLVERLEAIAEGNASE